MIFASLNLLLLKYFWKSNNFEAFIFESTATVPPSLGFLTLAIEDSVSSQVTISTPRSLTPDSIVANFSSFGTIIIGNSSFCNTRQVRRSRFLAL